MRRLIAPLAVSALVVAGIATVYTVTTPGNHASKKHVAQRPAASQIGASSAVKAAIGPDSTIVARVLPEGVKPDKTGTLPNGNFHYAYFSLPGKANENTIPDSGLTQENALQVHDPTRLTITAVTGVDEIPPTIVQGYGESFKQTWITVQGSKALLTEGANGLSTVRIDWVDNNSTYFTVTTQRLQTADGQSGLSDSDMESIAQNVQMSSG
jgi:hypothetical protein